MKDEIREKQPMRLNLQFFAEPDNNSGNANEPDNNQSNEPDNNSGNTQEQPTITQSQMNAIATKNKKEGMRSGKKEALKELGFSDETEAKKAVALLNALMNSQKTQDEQNNEALKKAMDEKADAEKRAAAIEAKLSILTAGVNPDSVDDVLALASSKVTEDKDLDTVLKEMKKESRYASFFTQTGSNTNNNSTGGTGNPISNNNNNSTGGTGGAKNFGAQLASKYSGSQNKKSSFFKN